MVDDKVDAGESLGQILSLAGAEVRVARDGPEALRTVADRARVVILDVGMPGMNGYEVAQATRKRFPNASTTLSALAGWVRDP